MFLQQTLNTTVTKVSAAVASGKSSFHSLLVLGEERKLSVMLPIPFLEFCFIETFFSVYTKQGMSVTSKFGAKASLLQQSAADLTENKPSAYHQMTVFEQSRP